MWWRSLNNRVAAAVRGKAAIGVYAIGLTLIGSATVFSLTVVVNTAFRVAEPYLQEPAARPRIATSAGQSAVVEPTVSTVAGFASVVQVDWTDRLHTRQKFWLSRITNSPEKWAEKVTLAARRAAPRYIVPNGATTDDPAAKFHKGTRSTYKTVCVRLCDGYFWPISFSTTEDQFDRDNTTCERSCGTATQLFVSPIPNSDGEGLQSLSGVPYAKLKTAHLFRSRYDATCKCNAQPWEQEAKIRHRLYALEAAQRKGDKATASEIAAVRTKVTANEAAAAKLKKSDTDKAVVELAILKKSSPDPVFQKASRAARPTDATAFRPASARNYPTPESGGLMALGAQSSNRGSIRRSNADSDWKVRVFNAN